MGARSEALRRELEPLLTHLGRLRFFVRRFPVEGVEERPEVVLSDDARAVAHLRSFQRMLPEEPLGHAMLGKALIAAGRGREAAAALRRALALAPDRRETLNNLAWILAAHPDPAFRRPDEAVELALRAAELERGGRPNTLNTLAAAYAAGGRFDRAIPVAGLVHLFEKTGDRHQFQTAR